MRWLALAIAAEVSVLLCLIVGFDWSLQATRQVTWDHAAVIVIYSIIRCAYSWKRIARPSPAAQSSPQSRAA